MDSLSDDIQRLIDCVNVDSLIDDIFFPAATTMLASGKRRRHNRGKDANEESMVNSSLNTNNRRGAYSKRHGNLRSDGGIYKGRPFSGGRQTGFVDLEVTSDNRNNLVVGTSDGGVGIGFLDDQQRVIAASHEKRYNAPIYTPSEKEIAAYNRNTEGQLDDRVKTCLG